MVIKRDVEQIYRQMLSCFFLGNTAEMLPCDHDCFKFDVPCKAHENLVQRHNIDLENTL